MTNPAMFSLAAIAVLLSAAYLSAADLQPLPDVQFQATSKGDSFAILGEKPAVPTPTLFVFGGDMRRSLVGEDVNHIGRILIPQGYLCVSLDIPCHGAEARPGEKGGDLTEWKNRIVKGESLVDPFTKQFSRVLDHLIAEKYSDADQIAVCGTSRGGYCAFHAAAADARVKQVIAFAPVTNLAALAEFQGAETDERVLAHSAIRTADKLAGRPVWIVIGNDDARVSTEDCLALGWELIRKSKGKLIPVPVEIRIVGTIGHRLHAVPKAEYGQLCAPHEEAARWLLLQRKAN